MCMVGGICPCVCPHVWRPAVHTGCLPQPLSVLFSCVILVSHLASDPIYSFMCWDHRWAAQLPGLREVLEICTSVLMVDPQASRPLNLARALGLPSSLHLCSAEVHAATRSPSLPSSQLMSLNVFIAEIWDQDSVVPHSFLSHHWNWTLPSVHHWTTLTAISFSLFWHSIYLPQLWADEIIGLYHYIQPGHQHSV